MSLKRSVLALVLSIASQQTAFANISNEATCEFVTENFQSRQNIFVFPFVLDLITGVSAFSSKERIEVDGKVFVARLYGTEDTDRFTLSLEHRLSDGSLFPRATASFYPDNKPHFVTLTEGAYLLKFKCSAI